MKIETTNTTPFININDNTTATFSIKPSAKAFKILSDSLYSNKILAIVRELSCNAYDSHVSVGKKDIPFTINLPSYQNNIFKIRDYGSGLSIDQVFQVYTTYFESTKTESNDYIGALGLGSKSPFCYVDNFNVISYYNGEKHIFVMYINENGFPSVTHHLTEKTEEENGLEVSFFTNEHDQHEFLSAASTVFMFFDTKPNIPTHRIDYPSKTLSIDDNITIYSSLRYTNGMYIRQGQVVYPIRPSDLNLTQPQRDIFYALSSYVVIDVPIGHVDVSASREALSLNPKTHHNIIAIIDNFRETFLEYCQAEILKCDNIWAATKKFSELNYLVKIGNLKGNPMKYNDHIVANYWKPTPEILDQMQKIGVQHSIFYPDRPILIIDRKIKTHQNDNYIYVDAFKSEYEFRSFKGKKLTDAIKNSDMIERVKSLFFSDDVTLVSESEKNIFKIYRPSRRSSLSTPNNIQSLDGSIVPQDVDGFYYVFSSSKQKNMLTFNETEVSIFDFRILLRDQSYDLNKFVMLKKTLKNEKIIKQKNLKKFDFYGLINSVLINLDSTKIQNYYNYLTIRKYNNHLTQFEPYIEEITNNDFLKIIQFKQMFLDEYKRQYELYSMLSSYIPNEQKLNIDYHDIDRLVEKFWLIFNCSSGSFREQRTKNAIVYINNVP